MLTTENVERALADGRHLGFGYACTRDAAPTKVGPLDRATVAVANELGLDAETFFHWANSKWGRWLADGIIGRDEPPTRATVRNYLNPEAVAEAIDFNDEEEGFPVMQTFATNEGVQPGAELVSVACDRSLDEGDAIIRTDFDPTIGSTGREFFVQVDPTEADVLLALIEVAGDCGGDEDAQEVVEGFRKRLQRVKDYRQPKED